MAIHYGHKYFDIKKLPKNLLCWQMAINGKIIYTWPKWGCDTTCPGIWNISEPFLWVFVWWHPSSFGCHQRLCSRTSTPLVSVVQPSRLALAATSETIPSLDHANSTWRSWIICQEWGCGPRQPWSIAPPNHSHFHDPVPKTTHPFPEDSSSHKSSTTQQKCSTSLHT